MRYFLRLAYNGRNYFGWQTQPDNVNIQDCIEYALGKLLRETIRITGAGRTDTGVHASQFYAHFDTTQDLIPLKNDLIGHLNAFLPNDIAIYDLFPVKDNAHARFDALSRHYQYRVTCQKNPFVLDSAYRIFFQPDINTMNTCADILKEYTDFTSFSKLHTQTKTNNCKITHAYWHEKNGLLLFDIIADRFLRNMVRAIVGTLLEVGKHKISELEFRSIIESKNRCNAGTSVPAHALYLTEITYPDDLFSLKDAPDQVAPF